MLFPGTPQLGRDQSPRPRPDFQAKQKFTSTVVKTSDLIKTPIFVEFLNTQMYYHLYYHLIIILSVWGYLQPCSEVIPGGV